ncbi:hypothetical protein ACFWHW_03985 [Streptomyces pharetrae]|uniref:hypothetical protein n=1 Tax=Streptomyces pharetrae TaxID=291370 RepID=UPI0036588ABE
MSRLARRPRADHKTVAAEARRQPGTWIVVNDYRSSTAADGIAYDIRSGYSHGTRSGPSPYHPAGAFEARTELVEDGVRVYARYVGGTQ